MGIFHSRNVLASIRAEIADVMTLYCHAIDQRHWALLERVFHHDAKWSVASLSGQWNDVRSNVERIMTKMGPTQHFTSNALIEVEGNAARCESNILAVHCVPRDGPDEGIFASIGSDYLLTGGGRFTDRLELRSGKWKITSRRGVNVWRTKQVCQPLATGTSSSVEFGTEAVERHHGQKRYPQNCDRS